jgi:hypothetical protein
VVFSKELMTMSGRLRIAFGALLTGLVACSSASSGDGAGSPESETHFDVLKELEIVDDAVVADPRSLNATSGVWSFRHVVEAQAEGGDPSAFVLGWLRTWETEAFNNEPLNVEPRGESMKIKVICPWLKLTPENACDATCGSCKAEKLDLAKAPFRLIAIANRMDLRKKLYPTGPHGEGRLVFGLTTGPADLPSSSPAAMSVIFEYALPDTMSDLQWAEAWHALGGFASYDEDYKNALAGITEQFVAHKGHLAQARTNESVTNWIWQMRQFSVDSVGALSLRPTTDTPVGDLNKSAALSAFVKANADGILNDRYAVPASMLGGSANNFLFRWSVDGVDEPTRKAFAAGTCTGCHSGENPTVDTAFHVSPFRHGTDKLSPFLWDSPGKLTVEMAHRVKLLQQALSGS